VILKRGRFLTTAVAVFVAALIVGIGDLLTESPPAAPRPAPRPGEPQRSGDDGGFSVVLAKPSEPYLVGRQKITIEPTVPTGDAIAQVDFFVNGKLVFTDVTSPYVSEFDFGEEIRRHTIVVTALTAGGRRAKVSFVSRSGDLNDDGSRPIAIIPAVVRDASGRMIDGLSVSDFALLENGARQPIVHFDNGPAPVSVAVVIHAASPEATARPALLRGAAGFARSLLSYHSLALIEPARPGAAPEFSYDHRAFAHRLGDGTTGSTPDGPPSLVAALEAAATALEGRPRGRALLLLLAESPAPTAPPPDTADAPAGDAAEAGKTGAQPEVPPALATALDRLAKAGVTLHGVDLGTADCGGGTWAELRTAAEETGGEFLTVTSPQEVEMACRRISESLLHRYLISYSPESSGAPGWRSIEIKLRQADLQVRARKGHFVERSEPQAATR
jgi:VWFA-related protein